MEVSEQFKVAETDGWLVSHRANSALPGYLIASAKQLAHSLSELSESALRELGSLLALAQDALKQQLNARRVYIGQFGHTPGLTVHFHIIPIYDWVEELFWQDNRYRVLQDFAEEGEERGTDGAELTFFVWREFCERTEPPAIKGPSIFEAVTLLRNTMETWRLNSG